MNNRPSIIGVRAFLGTVALSFLTGCATQQQPIRTVPPLYSAMPKIELPTEPQLLKVPAPPAHKPIAISIKIPKKATAAATENAIMRRGAVIKAGTSVVISVPSSLQKIKDNSSVVKDTLSRDSKETIAFRTDGYFNALEQYIERELIADSILVKDRSRFEAKLRDQRDGTGMTPTTAGSAPAQAMAVAKSGGADNSLSVESIVEKGIQLIGSISSMFTGKGQREEMFDTAEVIRAAQDGSIAADYVLQVNDLSVRHYTGEPLVLASRPEVQAVLSDNPGLRVGVAGDNGDAIPATLAQPWMLAHFNAKLINVKTGTIDWIGDYSVESLAVLDDGMVIDIGGRRITANAKTIVDAIVTYNDRIRDFYQKVQAGKATLESVYREVMEPVKYQGAEWQGDNMQFQRKVKAEAAEQSYAKLVKAYKVNCENIPAESKMDWAFYYVLDQPRVTPDLANPKTENDDQRLLKHVRALGSKITQDLLGTLKVTE